MNQLFRAFHSFTYQTCHLSQPTSCQFPPALGISLTWKRFCGCTSTRRNCNTAGGFPGVLRCLGRWMVLFLPWKWKFGYMFPLHSLKRSQTPENRPSLPPKREAGSSWKPSIFRCELASFREGSLFGGWGNFSRFVFWIMFEEKDLIVGLTIVRFRIHPIKCWGVLLVQEIAREHERPEQRYGVWNNFISAFSEVSLRFNSIQFNQH